MTDQEASTAGRATAPDISPPATKGELVYRQSLWTRITHWIWAICLFFLLLTGLQIFNSHWSLYIGQQSLTDMSNAVLQFTAENTPDGPRGYTIVFGHKIDTTGLFGLSGPPEALQVKAFPGWMTIPSVHDLGTGRVIHFFVGWVFVATMFVWFVASLINGHLKRDLIPAGADIRSLPGDIVDHARLRFRHGRSYNPVQKLAYFVVLFGLFPLIVATGLTMSPGMDAGFPWLLDLFGGRQTARTIHFGVMVLLVVFFVVHIVMVLAAGPINELRSMVTGWYRTSPQHDGDKTHG